MGSDLEKYDLVGKLPDHALPLQAPCQETGDAEEQHHYCHASRSHPFWYSQKMALDPPCLISFYFFSQQRYIGTSGGWLSPPLWHASWLQLVTEELPRAAPSGFSGSLNLDVLQLSSAYHEHPRTFWNFALKYVITEEYKILVLLKTSFLFTHCREILIQVTTSGSDPGTNRRKCKCLFWSL